MEAITREHAEHLIESAHEARGDAAYRLDVITRASETLQEVIEGRSPLELLGELRVKLLNRQSYDDVRRIEALTAMIEKTLDILD